MTRDDRQRFALLAIIATIWSGFLARSLYLIFITGAVEPEASVAGGMIFCSLFLPSSLIVAPLVGMMQLPELVFLFGVAAAGMAQWYLFFRWLLSRS